MTSVCQQPRDVMESDLAGGDNEKVRQPLRHSVSTTVLELHTSNECEHGADSSLGNRVHLKTPLEDVSHPTDGVHRLHEKPTVVPPCRDS